MDNEEIFYENNLTFDRIINFGWNRKFSFNENFVERELKLQADYSKLSGAVDER